MLVAAAVLHIFLTIAMGAAVYAMQAVNDRRLFVFLLLFLYWISLMLVVVAMVRIFRGSSAAQRSSGTLPQQPPQQPAAPTMR
jgi:hypothetical protein